jgi:hypothetical protein
MVDIGLTALALAGNNSRLASEQLAAAGYDVPDSTLRAWRLKHPDRYLELCTEHAPEIKQRVIQASQEIQQRALAATLKAINAAEQQLDDGETKDPSATAKNLALTHGIVTDKSQILQGLPDTIVRMDARDLLDDIRRDLGSIPSTAIEVENEALSTRADEGNAQED